MDNVHQLLGKRADKTVGEPQVVHHLLLPSNMVGITIPLVDEVLAGKPIPILPGKLIKSQRADGEIIGSPVGEQEGIALIAAPDPDKVIKQGGEPYHIGFRMLFTPCSQP